MSKGQGQSPIVATPSPKGAWSEQNWIYFISGNYQVNFYPSGSRVLEKNILKIVPKYLHVKILIPWCGPNPMDHDLNKLASSLYQEAFI